MRIIGSTGTATQSVTRDSSQNAGDAFKDLGSKVGHLLDLGSQKIPLSEIGSLLAETLDNLPILSPNTDTPNCCYERELLFCDPKGRFTILGLCWKPGAETPVHGHRAWGAVGVVDGKIGNRSFEKVCTDGEPVLTQTGEIIAGAGTVATVDQDPGGIHALFNPTQKPAFTVHIYGMDLSEDNCAVNIMYAQQGASN